MSDTNRFKTVTFSGEASFAVVRALRQRLETLAARQFILIQSQASPHAAEMLTAVTKQIDDVNQALAIMGGAA